MLQFICDSSNKLMFYSLWYFSLSVVHIPRYVPFHKALLQPHHQLYLLYYKLRINNNWLNKMSVYPENVILSMYNSAATTWVSLASKSPKWNACPDSKCLLSISPGGHPQYCSQKKIKKIPCGANVPVNPPHTEAVSMKYGPVKLSEGTVDFSKCRQGRLIFEYTNDNLWHRHMLKSTGLWRTAPAGCAAHSHARTPRKSPQKVTF